MDGMILLNIIILAGIAFFAAVILYFVSQKFNVIEDPKIFEIDDVLPQANCGACGKAGCHDFASACATSTPETFAKLYCPVGGPAVMKKVADLLGFQTTEKEETISVLRCQGTCQNAPDKTEYSGITMCRIADKISCGRSGCPDGCLRLGDCVSACQFDALHIDPETGIPVVDEEKCTSCGACVHICPRKLFEIRPKGAGGQRVYVACRNTQKGATARKNCKAACIACLKCTKINPQIKVENNLSYIPDTVSAPEFGAELAATCPTGAIIYTHQNSEVDHD